MKVVLLQKVVGIGDAEEIKDVAEGYARNFLFPKHLAVLASSEAIKELENRRNKAKKADEQDLIDQQSLAERLDGLEVVIKEKAGVGGVFYAAIGPQKVSKTLVKMGYKVDKTQVKMVPLKEAGESKIKIKLRHGLEAEVMLIGEAI